MHSTTNGTISDLAVETKEIGWKYTTLFYSIICRKTWRCNTLPRQKHLLMTVPIRQQMYTASICNGWAIIQ